MKSVNGKKIASGVFIGVLATMLVIYALVIILMFVWALYTSFKTSISYSISSYALPSEISFKNYTIAFEDLVIPVPTAEGITRVDVPMMIWYSLIYTFGGALVSTLVPCVVAYCVAKYKYKFGKVIYFIVIMVMTLPVVGSQVSELEVLHNLGLYNNFLGFFALKFNFMGIYFLVFYASFKTLPDTYVEAAHIDGANDFVVFFKIMFPLALTTFFIVFMLTAISYWNDITLPRVYLPSYPTFAYGLLYFSTTPGALPQSSAGAPVRIAACMLLVLPMFVLFAIFNKKMMGNLTMGGIKG